VSLTNLLIAVRDTAITIGVVVEGEADHVLRIDLGTTQSTIPATTQDTNLSIIPNITLGTIQNTAVEAEVPVNHHLLLMNLLSLIHLFLLSPAYLKVLRSKVNLLALR